MARKPKDLKEIMEMTERELGMDKILKSETIEELIDIMTSKQFAEEEKEAAKTLVMNTIWRGSLNTMKLKETLRDQLEAGLEKDKDNE